MRRAIPASSRGIELTADEKTLALRLQEAFAGFLEHTDAQIGRLIDYLEENGELDNTLFLLMSDNGASQEGGPRGMVDYSRYFNGRPETLDESLARIDEIGTPQGFNNYPWGWAQVGNTPGKRYKQNTHGGGIRDPLIAHWPKGIADKGGIRHQFHHVTDIAPTIFEIVGATRPDSRQRPSRRCRCTAPASLYSFAARGRAEADPQARAVFRDVRPSRHLGRRLEGRHLSRAEHIVRQGRVGALSPRQGFLRVPQPRRNSESCGS